MDPLTGAIAAPIAGGVLGNIFSGQDSEEARKMRLKALERWANISAPSSEAQRVNMNRFSSAGSFAPELESSHNQGSTAMNNAIADPHAREAQFSALRNMQNIASSGGITTEDRARLNNINLNTTQQDASRRGALMQNMAARGMGGSSAELAAQLQAQQSGTNRAASQSLDVNSQAQMRALNAMMQSGQMAGNMRSQDFQEKTEAARAQDMINNFNTRNQQAVASANVDRMNNAHGSNMSNEQNIRNMNTNIGNQQEMHNKGIGQQDFANQATIAAGMSGQYNGMANDQLREADRKRRMWGGMGAGVGEGMLVYGMKK